MVYTSAILMYILRRIRSSFIVMSGAFDYFNGILYMHGINVKMVNVKMLYSGSRKLPLR